MRMRRYSLVIAGVAASVALGACTASSGGGGTGGTGTSAPPPSTSSASSGPAPSSSSTAPSGGTLKVEVGTAPDSLDPGYGYTTQAAEGDNVVYTPLLAYAAKNGTAGTQLIPGLAKALPTVTDNGLTYKLQLRPNLKYSDGSPVKASDVAYSIERALTLPWGGSGFYASYIKGAREYQAKKAKSISGIVTDDSTGSITFHLTTVYGAFPNLIAFPSSAPVPSNTAMKVLSNDPPVGAGPYMFKSVTPNQGYVLVKNPHWAANNISGIPAGSVDEVDVMVQSNTLTEGQDVLNNTADIFDPGDTPPAALLSQITSQASDRFSRVPVALMYYFFLNTQVPPFNNKQVRLAVNMAMDRTALATLSSGELTPGCYFLPPTIVGHQSGGCASGDPGTKPSAATVAKAKQMIQQAGMAGKAVTVYSEQRDPRDKYCAYWADLLNQLGFKATIKSISDTVYFQTIGNRKSQPQTGFADWSQDFPNPIDFYLLMSKAGILDTNNENFGQVDDPYIEKQLSQLQPVPATKLSTVASKWASLDKYVEQQGYAAVFGYGTIPKFTSNRVDYSSLVLNPVNYIMYNTVQLNS
jgi:peptide/nickel transport system substrate-binding protein